MRELDVKVITENIKEMCIEATHFLTEDMKNVLDDSVTKKNHPLENRFYSSYRKIFRLPGMK